MQLSEATARHGVLHSHLVLILCLDSTAKEDVLQSTQSKSFEHKAHEVTSTLSFLLLIRLLYTMLYTITLQHCMLHK